MTYTGPGAAGSFGDDPASQEFIAGAVDPEFIRAWDNLTPKQRKGVVEFFEKPKRHSANLTVTLSVVDCAADPRAFIQLLLRTGGKHIRNVEISDV